MPQRRTGRDLLDRTTDCVAEYHLQMPRQWEGMSKMGKKQASDQVSFISFLKDPQKAVVGSQASEHEAMRQEIMRKNKHASQYVMDLLIYAHDRDAKERQTKEKARLREVVETKRSEDREKRLASANPPQYADAQGRSVPFGSTSVQQWMREQQPRDYAKFNSLLRIAEDAERREKSARCLQKIDDLQQSRVNRILEKEKKHAVFHQDQYEMFQTDQLNASLRNDRVRKDARQRVAQKQKAEYERTVDTLVKNETASRKNLERIAKERARRKEENLAELDRREQKVRAENQRREKWMDEVARKTAEKLNRKVKRANKRHGRFVNNVSTTTGDNIDDSRTNHLRVYMAHQDMLAEKRAKEVVKQEKKFQRQTEEFDRYKKNLDDQLQYKKRAWKTKMKFVDSTRGQQQQKREEQWQRVREKMGNADQQRSAANRSKIEAAKRRGGGSESPRSLGFTEDSQEDSSLMKLPLEFAGGGESPRRSGRAPKVSIAAEDPQVIEGGENASRRASVAPQFERSGSSFRSLGGSFKRQSTEQSTTVDSSRGVMLTEVPEQKASSQVPTLPTLPINNSSNPRRASVAMGSENGTSATGGGGETTAVSGGLPALDGNPQDGGGGDDASPAGGKKYAWHPEVAYATGPRTTSGKEFDPSAYDKKLEAAMKQKNATIESKAKAAHGRDEEWRKKVLDAKKSVDSSREEALKSIKQKNEAMDENATHRNEQLLESKRKRYKLDDQGNIRSEYQAPAKTPRPPSLVRSGEPTPGPYSARSLRPTRHFSPAAREQSAVYLRRSKEYNEGKEAESARKREEARDLVQQRHQDDHVLAVDKEERFLQRKLRRLEVVSARRAEARKEREAACEHARQLLDREHDRRAEESSRVKARKVEEWEHRHVEAKLNRSFRKAKKIDRPIDRYELRESHYHAKSEAVKSRFQPLATV